MSTTSLENSSKQAFLLAPPRRVTDNVDVLFMPTETNMLILASSLIYNMHINRLMMP